MASALHKIIPIGCSETIIKLAFFVTHSIVINYHEIHAQINLKSSKIILYANHISHFSFEVLFLELHFELKNVKYDRPNMLHEAGFFMVRF